MSTSTDAVAGAMASQVMQQELCARNIANISTPGFRRNIAIVESQAQSGASSNSAGLPSVTAARLDLSQGMLQPTHNDLDLAIQGEGFFTVSTEKGLRYTRNGSFRLDENRRLVTQDGDAVMGADGEIQLPEGASVTVGSQGEVKVDNAPVARLSIVGFDRPELLRETGSVQLEGASAGPRDARGFTIAQGSIEGSNVSPVAELVRMMSNFRDYEACARSLKSIEESASRLYAWARG